MKKIAFLLFAVLLLTQCLSSGAAVYETLRPDARGEEVVRLQQALLKEGYSLAVDGIYGRQTRRAVIQFQRAKGLKADGIAGNETLSLLYGSGAPQAAAAPATPAAPAIPTFSATYATLRPGMRGTAVQTMQEALNRHGFSLKADGIYGRATTRAVRKFQSQHKLRVDGIAGNQTLSLLLGSPAGEEGTGGVIDQPDDNQTAPDANPAAKTTGASVGQTLRRGSAPEQIAYLQQALLKAGISRLETDGVFGAQTAAAVRNFQTGNGMPASGSADPATLALLYHKSGTSNDALLKAAINHTGKALSLLSSARKNAGSVQTVPAGAALTILLERGEWYLASYKHKSGYVLKEQVRLINRPAPLVNLARGFSENTYTLTGDRKADLLGLAFTQLGFSGGSSRKPILDGTGPGGPYSKYGAHYQDPSESYCSYFVSWSARKAGLGEGIINNARDVDGVFYDAQQAFRYFFAPKAAQAQAQLLNPASRMNRSDYTPQAGDLIYFLWSNAKAQTTFSHIGIVYEVDAKYVYTLEGAAGGSVDTRMYALNDQRIVGYARPRYE
jgi:peptidoglycan hydrolase-like protein with peptidoglycan-binding domain